MTKTANKNYTPFKLHWRFIALLCVAVLIQPAASASGVDRRQMGNHYSPLSQITRSNVDRLEKAWEYHTGDLPPAKVQGLAAFEDHPTLIEGNLMVCSIERRVIALDPKTGKQRWSFDPHDLDLKTKKCRGIGSWVDAAAGEGSECKSRLFLGTLDYRLIAIDAKTGKPCSGFGDNGTVRMRPSKQQLFPGEVAATSDPAVVNDVVVVGSAVTDLVRIDPPSGRVLAFDARTGAPLWQFDPVPRDPNDPAMATWGKGTENFGQGNVWSSMAVDQERDLVFLPTTSVSDDYFGGNRPGANEYATSVVALRGTSGEVVWHRQLVHHNVWDYDLPTRPMLIDYPVNGTLVPALVQNTKMGLIFVFNRETGEPLVPIVERPVPQQGKVKGEVLSPTQPFPEGMPALTPQGFSPDDVWGFTPVDRWLCRNKVEKLVYGPIYTPVTEQGTVVMPPIGGGANWGGAGYDADSHIMVVATNRVPLVIQLIPREKGPVIHGIEVEGNGTLKFNNAGSQYVVVASPLLSVVGAPCSRPPWGALTAVDIVNKKIVWEKPLGSIRNLAPIPLDWNLGTPGAGGPLVTASGLVFIGYSSDDTLRAFDLNSGEILWEGALPAPGTAIPVTYELDGEQYVVIAAGGHSLFGGNPGDSVVAFKLGRGGE